MTIKAVCALCFACLVIGAAAMYIIGVAVSCFKVRCKEKTAAGAQGRLLRSITKMIFVTTQISALVWVFTSYGIAIYSTVMLGQVYTMSELSEPAIHTILGVGVLKVLENIFEHNDGGVFGKTKNKED